MRREQHLVEISFDPDTGVGERKEHRRTVRGRGADSRDAQPSIGKSWGVFQSDGSGVIHFSGRSAQMFVAVNVRVQGDMLVCSLSKLHCVFCEALALEKDYYCGRCKF